MFLVVFCLYSPLCETTATKQNTYKFSTLFCENSQECVNMEIWTISLTERLKTATTASLMQRSLFTSLAFRAACISKTELQRVARCSADVAGIRVRFDPEMAITWGDQCQMSDSIHTVQKPYAVLLNSNYTSHSMPQSLQAEYNTHRIDLCLVKFFPVIIKA